MNRKEHIKTLRRKAKRRILLLVTLLIVTVIALILALPFLSKDKEQDIKQSDNRTVQSSSTSPSSNIESKPTPQEEVVWEKQEQPVQLPILMYHAIHVMDSSEAANANLIVDPEVFESHLKALTEAGYYTVTPEEAHKILTENVLPKGKKVVWLTFDDSLWDFYDIAYPLLKKYEAKATNNVITGSIGQPGNLTIEQMLEMKENGMSFQGHTVNHPDLEVSTPESQQQELSEGKTYLDSLLQQDTLSLAYPAGRYSMDTLTIAETAGYKMATTTNQGLASLADGLLTLDRVRIVPTTTAQNLLQEISTD